MGLKALAMLMAVWAPTPEPVDLTLVLPPKAVIEYRLERSERTNGGDWDVTTSAYQVEVTSLNAAEYRTRWRNLLAPNDPPLVMQTDEALVPVSLINADEVLNGLEREIAGDDEDAAATALAMLRGMGVEALTGLVAKDFILTAMGQGTNLVPGVTSHYEQPGLSLGESGSMTMLASFLLESVKPDAGSAVVVWTNEVDPESARKALPHIVRDLLELTNVDDRELETKIASLLANTRLTKRTTCRYDIDMPTGLATHVLCEEIQDIQVAGESQRREVKLVATQRLLR